MSAGRDDIKLVRLVLEVHGKLQSHADPGKWIDDQLEMLNLSGTADVSETVWGRLVMERAGKTALYWLEEMRKAYGKMQSLPDFMKAYGESFSASIDGISSFVRPSPGTGTRRHGCPILLFRPAGFQAMRI
jgi:ATP-dependent helicase/nuclease subunit A